MCGFLRSSSIPRNKAPVLTADMWRRTSLDNSALERPSPPQRPTMADFMQPNAAPTRLRGVNRLGGASYNGADSASAGGPFWPSTISEETGSMASSPTNSQRSSFDLTGTHSQRASFDITPPLDARNYHDGDGDVGHAAERRDYADLVMSAGSVQQRRSLDNPQSGGGSAPGGFAKELRRASVDSPGAAKGDRQSVEEPAPLRILIAEDNKVWRGRCGFCSGCFWES